MLPDLTTDETKTSEKRVKSDHELKVYNYFSTYLVPKLQGFKDRRINWEYMVSAEYKDEKVVEEFVKVVEEVHEKYL